MDCIWEQALSKPEHLLGRDRDPSIHPSIRTLPARRQPLERSMTERLALRSCEAWGIQDLGAHPRWCKQSCALQIPQVKALHEFSEIQGSAEICRCQKNKRYYCAIFFIPGSGQAWALLENHPWPSYECELLTVLLDFDSWILFVFQGQASQAASSWRSSEILSHQIRHRPYSSSFNLSECEHLEDCRPSPFWREVCLKDTVPTCKFKSFVTYLSISEPCNHSLHHFKAILQIPQMLLMLLENRKWDVMDAFWMSGRHVEVEEGHHSWKFLSTYVNLSGISKSFMRSQAQETTAHLIFLSAQFLSQHGPCLH